MEVKTINGYDIKDETARNQLNNLNIDLNNLNIDLNNSRITSLAKLENICALPYRYDGPNGLQGGCYCGNGNVVCYFTESNELEVISLETGEVIKSYSAEIFGHGNGICKIDNYIYLLGTGDSNNNCYRIPYDSFGSYDVIDVYGENKIPVGSNISCIAYNPDDEKVYISIAPVFDTMTIYEFSKDLSTLITTYTIDNENKYGGFITNIGYWNKFLLIHYNYGKLQLFNTSDMTLFKTIDLDKYVGTRIASEIEWIDTYEDGKIIVGTRGFIGKSYGDGYNFFATTDLMESSSEYPINTDKASTQGKNELSSFKIYVDNTSETINLLRDGSRFNPFNNLYEALQCACNPKYNNVEIYLKGDFSDDHLCVCNSNINVKLLNWESQQVISVKSFIIENSNNVCLQNITTSGNLNITNSTVHLSFNDAPKTQHNLNLECDRNSSLIINCRENEVKLLGNCKGIIEFNSYNHISGLVGVYDESEEVFTDYLKCRNVKNAYTRCRLTGSDYTPSNSFEFNVPISRHEVVVQVGSNYYRLPITAYAKSYSIPVDNDTLSVVISNVDTTLHYTLTTTNTTIYDCHCYF